MVFSTLLNNPNGVLALVALGSAAVAALGALWSAYNGTLREMMENIRRIRHIEKKQEDMADAIVLLGHAEVDDAVRVDAEAMEKDLRDGDEGPGRYAHRGLYRGGGRGFEEQEEETEVAEPE